MTNIKQRTTKQNSALHKYFEMLANELNETGHDMRKTLKPEIEIPWTKESVKEFLYRPIMKAMYQKKSTTELSTKELQSVAETLQKHLVEKLNIDLDFPSIESQTYKDQEL